MTFKHTKFEDSSIMRSFEKIAQEKGLIKNDPVVKIASKKEDKPVADNLMENILFLCSKMRVSGFNKQAEELELNLLQYKKANSLYHTFNESGEDLVNQAHPKGSHQLDGLSGEYAVIETILDQQLKSVKMVEKKPTGKLANQNILNAVKLALGQEKSNWDAAIDLLAAAKNAYMVAKNTAQKDLLLPQGVILIPAFNSAINNPTTEGINNLKGLIFSWFVSIKNGALSIWLGGVGKDTWDQIKHLESTIYAHLNAALTFLNAFNSQSTESAQSSSKEMQVAVESQKQEANPSGKLKYRNKFHKIYESMKNTKPAEYTSFIQDLNNKMSKIGSWIFFVKAEYEAGDIVNKTVDILNDIKTDLSNLKQELQSVPEDEVMVYLPSYKIRLKRVESDMNNFQAKWII